MNLGRPKIRIDGSIHCHVRTHRFKRALDCRGVDLLPIIPNYLVKRYVRPDITNSLGQNIVSGNAETVPKVRIEMNLTKITSWQVPDVNILFEKDSMLPDHPRNQKSIMLDLAHCHFRH